MSKKEHHLTHWTPGLNKIFKNVLHIENRENTERIVSYLKFYTFLILVSDNLDAQKPKKAFNYLKITYDRIATIKDDQEAHYLNNLIEIIDSLQKQHKKIVRNIQKFKTEDPLHTRTRLQLAQNICILRIIKLSM